MSDSAAPRLAPAAAFEAGSPERYTGPVNVARVIRAGDDSVRAYEVCFAPGSRTVWHAHAGEQLLVVLSGRCVVQCADGPARYLAPGEGIRVAAGVRHWHGALPTGPGSHLALNAHGPTDWGRPVSDVEFSVAVRRSGAGDTAR
jgi:quercetin dioxygenase-like cupin family protein